MKSFSNSKSCYIVNVIGYYGSYSVHRQTSATGSACLLSLATQSLEAFVRNNHFVAHVCSVTNGARFINSKIPRSLHIVRDIFK
jgi:hypothetical protein